MAMDFIKDQLGFTDMKPLQGSSGGGCICEGRGYTTSGGDIFVKSCGDPSGTRVMFEGELESLQAIFNTRTLRCPRPLGVAENPQTGAVVLVTEFLHMDSLGSLSAQLGSQLARLHLHNRRAIDEAKDKAGRVGHPEKEAAPAVRQFGFHVQTCCGRIPQSNAWHDDWVEFFTRDRLQAQIDLIEREYGDRKVRELWPLLLRRLPDFFRTISVRPALLHGDLWSGNVAAVDQQPVVFDPASCYGHDEYDLGISAMFRGFSADFYRAYHSLLPAQPGFAERSQLYQLFNNLNHWNHFGSSYRSGCLSLMEKLIGK